MRRNSMSTIFHRSLCVQFKMECRECKHCLRFTPLICTVVGCVFACILAAPSDMSVAFRTVYRNAVRKRRRPNGKRRATSRRRKERYDAVVNGFSSVKCLFIFVDGNVPFAILQMHSADAMSINVQILINEIVLWAAKYMKIAEMFENNSVISLSRSRHFIESSRSLPLLLQSQPAHGHRTKKPRQFIESCRSFFHLSLPFQ